MNIFDLNVDCRREQSYRRMPAARARCVEPERNGLGNPDSTSNGSLCLNAASLMPPRSENAEANTTDAQCDFKGEGGSDCAEGREDIGRVGTAV